MKNLFLIALAFVSIQTFAQERKQMQKKGDRADNIQNYTAEEQAELQTKKLTLALDLSEAQQKQVMDLNLEQATARKNKMSERQANKKNQEAKNPPKQDRLKAKNASLDKQIEMKAKMKKILTAEQYIKWESLQKERKQNMRRSAKQQSK